MRVLIVDDFHVFRKMVKSMLPAGFEVLEASNGKEGLETLRSNSDIDLILSDVNMPVMNGLDMVTEISRDDNLKHIPVMILTSERDPAMKQKAEEIGVKHWLAKPFKKDQFQEALRTVVSW